MSKILTFPTKPGNDFSATPTVQRSVKLPPGRAGIVVTLKAMRRYVDEYKGQPRVRELTLSLVRNLRQKDYLGEINTLFDYVKYRIRYTRDIYGIETVQTPDKTLEYGQGDCDDKATLLAAMLESIGFETRFHAMGRAIGNICHVIVEVKNPLSGLWIPLETTQDVGMGWLPPDVAQSIYLHGNGDVQTINGLGKALKKAVKKVTKPVQKIAAPVLKVVKPIAKVTGTESLFKAMALPTATNVKAAIHDPALQAGAVGATLVAAAPLLTSAGATTGATGATSAGAGTLTNIASAAKTVSAVASAVPAVQSARASLQEPSQSAEGGGGGAGSETYSPGFTSKISVSTMVIAGAGITALVYLALRKKK